MSTQTDNLKLNKPGIGDFYDIAVHNENMDIIDEEITELKKSVSDGKTLVANTITGQGVATVSDATFAIMATNINTVATNKYNEGVSATKKGTASASQVLSGYTFTNASSVGASGTMTNNGAVNQTLSINGTYTIPAGYHNGSGKVTQNITTKVAATYTPSDSAQTIAAGQYLSGVQTISAVPTETKTVTAGTSASTVNRTSGKYMTSVTVSPTPSQTKTVTMTSSPLTITPDSGKLLSSVTVNASLGKKYASGTVSITKTTDSYYMTRTSGSGSTTDSNNMNQVVLPTTFSPSIVRFILTDSTGWKYQTFVTPTSIIISYGLIYPITVPYPGLDTAYYKIGDAPQLLMSGLTIRLPGSQMLADFKTADYEAWE